MGDVYKMVFIIRDFFPWMNYAVVEENHGQMIVWREETSRELADPLSVAQICDLQFSDVSIHMDAFRIRSFTAILADLARMRHQPRYEVS